MALKWPTLREAILKLISLILFIASLTMEIMNFQHINKNRHAHCIKGFELGEELGVNIILLFGITLSDVYYIILIILAIPFTNCNFGADLLTIGYNFVAGIIGFVSLYGISKAVPCGNLDFPVIQNGVVSFTALASLFHVVNGGVALIFLPQIERTFKRRPQNTRT